MSRVLALSPRRCRGVEQPRHDPATWKRGEEALASHDHALAIKTSAYAEAWYNRGRILQDQLRFAEALGEP